MDRQTEPAAERSYTGEDGAAREAGNDPWHGARDLTPEHGEPPRPRVKLLSKGPECLTGPELLSLVIGGSGRREPAVRTAGRLLRAHGLAGLARLRPSQWCAERGIGKASAARMTAAFELARRAYGAQAEHRPRVNRPRRAFEMVRHIGRARREHLVGLYLDAQNGLLHRETISIGSLNTTRTHPREILYPAVVHLALGFILAHNHPSGCLEPSPEDADFTRAVGRAGQLMGIELYDHLIVTGNGYVSLRERGIL